MTLETRLASKIKGGSNQGKDCSVAELLAELKGEDLATLRKALQAPWRVVPHVALERALLKEGHQVGTGMVGKHRRGDCRCSK